jgi:hypothetical protein
MEKSRNLVDERDHALTGMDIHRMSDLAFPKSLPEFQRLFPDDAA